MATAPNKKNNKLLFSILTIMLILFVALQLYTLSNIGTKGEQVSNLKKREAEIKIENEIKRAHILELQSNQAVLNGLNEKINLVPKNIISIDSSETSVSALKNE